VTVPLVGTAVTGQAHLSIGPATVDWGSQLLRTTVTLGFDVSNTGNLPLTITKAKGPTGVFAAPDPLPEGLTIGPGAVVHQDVTFRPKAIGPRTGSYLIVADDGTGDHIVTLTGRGSKKLTLPAPKARSWQFNGAATTARVAPGGVQLTKAARNQRGSAFAKTPLSPVGLTASFQVQVSGGSGGEGLVFVLADGSRTTPKALGAGAAGLGWAGIPGLAIAFDTVSESGEPSVPLVGIPLSGSNAGLQYVAASPLPSLRKGWHTVTINVTSKPSIRVTVDGAHVINIRLPSGLTPLPAKVYAGFTASTSRLTDRHLIRKIKITALSY
jgi:hypothetical protein